jgi:hypothetical protein
MKSTIFWDMTPCSPLSVNRGFGGIYGLHLQVATCLLASCWTYFFGPEDGGDMLLRNVGWRSTDYTASYPRRWYSSSNGKVHIFISINKHFSSLKWLNEFGTGRWSVRILQFWGKYVGLYYSITNPYLKIILNFSEMAHCIKQWYTT